MQILGVTSLFLCVVTMFFLYVGLILPFRLCSVRRCCC